MLQENQCRKTNAINQRIKLRIYQSRHLEIVACFIYLHIFLNLLTL